MKKVLKATGSQSEADEIVKQMNALALMGQQYSAAYKAFNSKLDEMGYKIVQGKAVKKKSDVDYGAAAASAVSIVQSLQSLFGKKDDQTYNEPVYVPEEKKGMSGVAIAVISVSAVAVIGTVIWAVSKNK